MTAILKREFASYFTSPLGYVYLAVFYGFSGLFLWITCLSSGSADMQYVFLWMFFIMMILIPILTMRTMADDKRQKTDQLTLTSPGEPVRSGCGKIPRGVLHLPYRRGSYVRLRTGSGCGCQRFRYGY